MTTDVFHVPPGGRFEFELGQHGESTGRDSPFIVMCDGIGSVSLPSGIAALWCASRGRVLVSSPDAQYTIKPNDIYVTDSERPTSAATMRAGQWFVIAASQRAWGSLLRKDEFIRIPGPAMFPRFFADASNVARQLEHYVVRCEREARSGRTNDLHDVLLSGAVEELQYDVDELVARCPGKSLMRRRHVFLRLQRVRHILMSRADRQLDLADLAKLANYSRCHLIKAFNLVFGETPYSFSLKCRVERARELMGTSAMTIGEIARATGFEHRSAFCRAFQRQFGISATEARNGALKKYSLPAAIVSM